MSKLIKWFKQDNRLLHTNVGVLIEMVSWVFCMIIGLTWQQSIFMTLFIVLAAMVAIELKASRIGEKFSIENMAAGVIVPILMNIVIAISLLIEKYL